MDERIRLSDLTNEQARPARIRLSDLKSGGEKRIRLSDLPAAADAVNEAGVDATNTTSRLAQPSEPQAHPSSAPVSFSADQVAQHELRPVSKMDRFLGRVKDAAGSMPSLSENLSRLLADQMYNKGIDLETGADLTKEQLQQQSQVDRQIERASLVPEPAESKADAVADFLGHAGREIVDPIALATAPIGGGAGGAILNAGRLGKLAAVGAGYEAAAEATDQKALTGGVEDLAAVGERSVYGAAGAVGLDVLFRGLGKGIKQARGRGDTVAITQLESEALEKAVDAGFGVDEARAALDVEVAKVDVGLLDDLPNGNEVTVPVAEPLRMDSVTGGHSQAKVVVANSVSKETRSKIEQVLPPVDDVDLKPKMFRRVELDEVSDAEKIKLAEAGYVPRKKVIHHYLDNNHVRHALKRHANDTFPLVRDDFSLLPDIYRNADNVVVDERAIGNSETISKVIKYTKAYADQEYVVEALETISNKKGALKFKTMYKRGLGKGNKAGSSVATDDVTSPVMNALGESDIEPPAGNNIVNNEFGVKIGQAEVGAIATGTKTVLSPNDVAHVAAPFRKDAQESFLAVVADENGDVLNIARVHRGTADQVAIDPTLVAGSVVNTPGAKQAWIVHNHPAGSVAHSGADVDVSAKVGDILNGTGIDFQGSVVVGDGGRVFGHLKGNVDEILETTALPRHEALPVTERRIEQRLGDAPPIQSEADARAYLDSLGGDADGVLLVDAGNKPLRFIGMSSDEMTRLRTGAEGGSAKLLQAMDEANADGFVVRSSDAAAAGNMNGFAEVSGRRLLDVYDGEGKSLRGVDGIPSQSTFYANPFAPAAKVLADSVRAHGGRTATEAFAGGTLGGISSDEELFSPNWWLDVAAGSAVAVTGFNALRAGKIVGKSSALDIAITRTGNAISKLPFIGTGPKELATLKARQRAMRDLLDGHVADVGHALAKYTPAERAMMSDLIEGKGVIAELNHVHAQAAELDKFITASADKAKELGLIPESVESGGYLHRYYEKYINPLSKDADFKEAKGQNLGGTYSMARGTNDVVPRKHVSDELGAAVEGDKLIEALVSVDGKVERRFFTDGEPLPDGASALDRAWSVRGTKDGELLIHRDWSKAERDAWGEVRDAGYRFVRGMGELNHDLSMGTLYKKVADNSEWTRVIAGSTKNELVDGQKYIFVPATKVGKGSKLTRYGNLAGKHVRADVWNGIARYGKPIFAPGSMGQVYRKWLGKWKIYSTVYNPVSHMNNSFSNLEMLYLAGYTPKELGEGISVFRRGKDSDVFRRAAAEGLFDSDFAATSVKASETGEVNGLEAIADMLRSQKDGDMIKSLDAMMTLKTRFAKKGRQAAGIVGKPLKKAAQFAQDAYQVEDMVFKLGVFDAELKKGKSSADAAEVARQSFFDYTELPDAVRLVRDLPIGAPFISYTYFAVPAIVRHVIERPERALALFAGMEAMNYAGLATNTEDGIEPGEYWDISRADENLSSPWDQGRAISGVRNTINIPYLEGYKLSLARAHAGGNPFAGESGERQFSVPGIAGFWGSDIFGSNPTHILIDVLGNEDWKGRHIYEPGDSKEDKVKKSMAYMYQSVAPKNVLTPGSYHQAKVLDGLANSDNEVVQGVVGASNGVLDALGLGQLTGLDRGGNEVSTRDAILGSFGIKARTIDHGRTLAFSVKDAKKKITEKRSAQKKIMRLMDQGRLTKGVAATKLARINKDIQVLIKEQEGLARDATMLKNKGLFRSER